MPSPDTPAHFNPPGCALPIGGYSQATIVPGGWPILVLAGQVGTDENNHTPEDATGQYRIALTNVAKLLKANGLGPEHIIKINSWLVEPIDLNVARELRSDVLNGAMPPATLCYVSALATPKYLVEIEVWATGSVIAAA